MNELYQLFRPAFTSEVFMAGLRDVANTRQAHMAATIRKEPESVEFGLRNISALHRFNTAQVEALRLVPAAAIEEVGFVSAIMFGTDSRVFEFMLLAVNNVDEYSLEAVKGIYQANQQVDVNAVIAGEENFTDVLMWMRHLGQSLTGYLIDWVVQITQDQARRAAESVGVNVP